MDNTVVNIFKAIFEDKWLAIEYKNKKDEITKYWIAIKDINVLNDTFLIVDGLHLGQGTIKQLKIYVDSIISSYVVDGTFYQDNKNIKDDIENNPDKYRNLFINVSNLKILNYYIDCNRMDSVPYKSEYTLIKYLDDDKLKDGVYTLSEEQYLTVIRSFQIEANKEASYINKQLCLNVLSIYDKKGLYVLAYRKLNFDVKNKCFRPEDNITLCQQFTVNGTVENVHFFLENDELELLNDFQNNLSMIEDCIVNNNSAYKVDDMPYVIAISRDIVVDLEHEYKNIYQMMQSDQATVPLKAFFGQLIKQPQSRKDYPITILDNKTNLDQLLAINNALKYPLTYVQGPPGTGKTNTIINTVLNFFFNEKTVLFSSYNNKPIDDVCDKLQSLKYNGNVIPFPIIRLGNSEKLAQALDYIKVLYEKTKLITVYENTLDKYNESIKNNASKLSGLMKRYEEILQLEERKEAINKMLEKNDNYNFQIELQAGQLDEIDRKLKSMDKVTNQQALDFTIDSKQYLKYLNYISCKYIKRLAEPKYHDLLDIVYSNDKQQRVVDFRHYVQDNDKLKLLLRVFPIIATSCISARDLGDPAINFDISIIDEASQCNAAISLIPIIRAQTLLLAGDCQQLNPVILLDEKTNNHLMEKYRISKEYDYRNNSIYKTFLAADCISTEILLSHHYRCDKNIINFCNKKYYNNKLLIETKDNKDSVVLANIKENNSQIKNASEAESEAIIAYLKHNKEKSIGIITPFVNQKKCIEAQLEKNGITNVSCGTVHAYQGDEKDEIIFSLAISDKTTDKTYNWLKNNNELLNVAVSRAKNKLMIVCCEKEIERLHSLDNEGRDDLYELVNYAKNKCQSEITTLATTSRALGVKPYSSETEEAFLTNLSCALDNIVKSTKKCIVRKEVAISQVFQDNYSHIDLFYTGRFDFVVYEKNYNNQEIPILAIELDGKEHYKDEVVKNRDNKKNKICQQHGFTLIRVDNSYARRYNYMKEILIDYFAS